MNAKLHCLCLAPMMDRTDRHFRFLLRLISPRTFLYTEMITAAALVNGNSRDLLQFDASEQPVGIQLGGSEPRQLAAAGAMAEAAGYDEINLNVGCPSDRVQAGCFGAALMLQPDLVAASVRALRKAVGLPVTVKTRIGVDNHDSYEFLRDFTASIVDAGCELLIVHARKAWLSGLSPRQNREVPPLDYSRVHRLKGEFPELEIILNGGLSGVDDVLENQGLLDGVMLGRTAYDRPLSMRELELSLFGPGAFLPVDDILDEYLRYMDGELRRGQPLRRMARHLMGMLSGRPGARAWRRSLAALPNDGAGLDQLRAHIEELRGQWPTTVADTNQLHQVSDNRYNDASAIPGTVGGNRTWEHR